MAKRSRVARNPSAAASARATRTGSARARKAASGRVKEFSTRQYKQSPRSVIAHARSTGHALVVGKHGRAQVAIDIPKKKLPALD